MDMADALNVMLHASSCEDGSEGYAVRDLFRAEDSDKIRSFLKKHLGFGPPPPPGSYRVYQRPGNGVFIPAGCVHQVCIFRFHFS